jgi:membrane protein YdbS with pleckstrin-like domain
MNSQGYKKTTIKSLIALALFSLVLEISSKTILNYLIFVTLWITMTILYEIYKYAAIYSITDRGVFIKTPIKSRLVTYSQMKETFIVEGYLQKRFGLSSVYLVTSKGVMALRDLNDGNAFLKEVNRKLGMEQIDTQ